MNTSPAPPPLPPRAALARVTIYLALLGAVTLFTSALEAVAFIRHGGNLSLGTPAAGVLIWVVARLAWKGKRGAWNTIAVLAPLAAGAWLGALVAVTLTTPWNLLVLFFRTGTWGPATGVTFLATVALLILLARDTHRHSFLAQRSLWTKPAVLSAASLLPTAALVGLLLLALQGSWTKPAVELARQQQGDGYSYRIQSWHQESRSGQVHGRATVIAFNDTEIRTIDVEW